MNKINDNIRSLRISKGLTQQELADKLFVTRQCISRWEQGKTLPDINIIEKLTEVFDCSLNDLIDDNSIKSITVNEAIRSKRNKKIMLGSLVISILAITGTILSILVFNKPQEILIEKYDEYYGYVTDIDYSAYKLTLEEVNTKELHYFDLKEMFIEVEDNRKNKIIYNEINIHDKIHLSQESENDYRITVLDSKIDEELYGIYISPLEEEYLTFSEIQSALEVNYVWVSYGRQSSRMNQTFSYDYIIEDYYHETIYDIYIKVNPVKVDNDIHIGLITSNGVKFIETIDTNDMENLYTYEGSFLVGSTDQDYIDNYNITYNIHIQWEFSYSTIEVFEYDKNNALIKETVINNLTELRDFKADENAVQCLLKVNTTYSFGISTFDHSKVYNLLLGESIEIYQSDDYGLVFTEWFLYR